MSGPAINTRSAVGSFDNMSLPKQSERRFRKCERLRHRADFERIFAHRCSAADELLVLYAVRNGLEWSRLGSKVNRRIGNAVVRNRLRRTLREAFRTMKGELPQGYDLLCIVRINPGDRRRALAASLGRLARHAVRRLTAREDAKGTPAERNTSTRRIER